MNQVPSYAQIQHTAQSFVEVAESAGRELRDRLDIEGTDRRVRAMVHEHPFAAVGAALALGYFAGRVLSRR